MATKSVITKIRRKKMAEVGRKLSERLEGEGRGNEEHDHVLRGTGVKP